MREEEIYFIDALEPISSCSLHSAWEDLSTAGDILPPNSFISTSGSADVQQIRQNMHEHIILCWGILIHTVVQMK